MKNHQMPSHGPTSRCKTYAPILPLLDEPGIDATAQEEALDHVATCAYCQQQRAAYRQLEVAARRHLGPPASPTYHTEEIMRDLLGEPVTTPDEPAARLASPRPIRPPRPRHVRRVLAGVPALAAVLVIVLLAVILFANHVRPTGPVTPPPTQQEVNRLYDVSMVSANEGWAVGDAMTCGIASGSPTPSTPVSGCSDSVLLMHYLNGTWSSVPNTFDVGGLTTIQMLSATNGWAAGNTLIVHYDGHSWQEVPNPTRLILNRLDMLSDTDGWAIGSSGGDVYEPGLLIHYDGQSWTPVQLPASLGINKQVVMAFDSLAMTSPDEGWAAGTIFGGSPSQVGVILHDLNGQWTVQYRLDNADMNSISMLSVTDGWATGRIATYSTSSVNGTPTPTEIDHPLLLHYVQGKWTTATNLLSDPSAVTGQIQMLSATDGWITGANPSTWLHYDGKQWQPVVFTALKNVIDTNLRMQLVSSTEGWAVGTQLIGAKVVQTNHGVGYRGGEFVPLFLHFHDGTWSLFHSP